MLAFSLEEEGVSLSGELRASYNSDKTGVVLSGALTTSLFFSADDLRICLKLEDVYKRQRCDNSGTSA